MIAFVLAIVWMADDQLVARLGIWTTLPDVLYVLFGWNDALGIAHRRIFWWFVAARHTATKLHPSRHDG